MIARITSSGELVLLRAAAEEDHGEDEDTSEGGTESTAAEGGEAKVSHAAEECIHLLEAGKPIDACQAAPNPILPPVSELVYAVLAFAVLFALMYTKAFPAVKKAMDARTNRIRENLDEAERAKGEAQGILEEYQRQLAEARTDAGRIIEEARQTADQLRRDLLARAEADVAELRQRNTDELAAAQERAIADLRAQVATIALDVAEKVVERNLDRDTNIALIESYINQVGSQRA